MTGIHWEERFMQIGAQAADRFSIRSQSISRDWHGRAGTTESKGLILRQRSRAFLPRRNWAQDELLQVAFLHVRWNAIPSGRQESRGHDPQRTWKPKRAFRRDFLRHGGRRDMTRQKPRNGKSTAEWKRVRLEGPNGTTELTRQKLEGGFLFLHFDNGTKFKLRTWVTREATAWL